MKLIKIDNQFINIDLIESVRIEGDFVTMNIAGEEYLFAGKEAEALKCWFNQYAFDLMQHQATAAEQLERAEPSIDMLHAQVRSLGLFRKPFVLD